MMALPQLGKMLVRERLTHELLECFDWTDKVRVFGPKKFVGKCQVFIVDPRRSVNLSFYPGMGN